MVAEERERLRQLCLKVGHPLFERAKSVCLHKSSFHAIAAGAVDGPSRVVHPTDTLGQRQASVCSL